MLESIENFQILDLNFFPNSLLKEHLFRKRHKKINFISLPATLMGSSKPSNLNEGKIRPLLDAVLKQGVLRLFQHGLVRLSTPPVKTKRI